MVVFRIHRLAAAIVAIQVICLSRADVTTSTVSSTVFVCPSTTASSSCPSITSSSPTPSSSSSSTTAVLSVASSGEGDCLTIGATADIERNRGCRCSGKRPIHSNWRRHFVCSNLCSANGLSQSWCLQRSCLRLRQCSSYNHRRVFSAR